MIEKITNVYTTGNMKAILEFNLPEDQEDYDRVNKALDLCSVLWDFQNYLRGQVKYSDKPDNIEQIYDKWFETLSANDINLEKLYR